MSEGITSRQELLIALSEACELEHNLCCIYLFAAFSMKGDAQADGIPQEAAETVRGWKDQILEVARQEMAHLGIVCNLRSVVGGSAHFGRPNFPQPPRHYPPEIPFTLERFGESSLRRFIEFERPETARSLAASIAPKPLSYTRVGDLYRQIRAGFKAIPEDQLFLNKEGPQDQQAWSSAVVVMPVRDQNSALEALDAIIVQGEGTPQGSQDSHFGIFRRILGEIGEFQKKYPDLDPARPVVENPRTRAHRDAPDAGTLITDPFSKAVAELFNVSYGIMLHILGQYYAFAGEVQNQQNVLRRSAVMAMGQVVRTLGQLLTRLPAGEEYPGKTAGAGFENYGDDALMVRPALAWSILTDWARQSAVAAQQLASANATHATVLSGVSARWKAIAAQLESAKPT
jgi:hypothetical protein